MIELFTHYVSEDFSKYTHFLLMFRTSLEYPLSQEEKEVIQNYFIDALPKSANVRFGFGMDRNLGTEVSLLLLTIVVH